jgi:hypothetical protein
MATTQITSTLIADEAVTTAKLDDDAVTTAKIDDEAVTAAKMATTQDWSNKTITMPAAGITGAMLTSGGWTYTAQTATTSGTTVVLTTAIPAWATEVQILFNGVSTNTNGQMPLVELGDAGGYEDTSYTQCVGTTSGSAAQEGGGSDGFYLGDNFAASGEAYSGIMHLARWATDEHLWIAGGTFNASGGNISYMAGQKTLSEALTSIRLNTPGAAATFDAGEARVRYR